MSNQSTHGEHVESDATLCGRAITDRPEAPSLCRLSPREREVLSRALDGSHNKAIAYDLGIADATVRVLIARAAGKFGVHSRRELLEKIARLNSDKPDSGVNSCATDQAHGLPFPTPSNTDNLALQ